MEEHSGSKSQKELVIVEGQGCRCMTRGDPLCGSRGVGSGRGFRRTSSVNPVPGVFSEGSPEDLTDPFVDRSTKWFLCLVIPTMGVLTGSDLEFRRNIKLDSVSQALNGSLNIFGGSVHVVLTGESLRVRLKVGGGG